METAHRIASDCFPNINRIVLSYGIKYTNKYGEDKQAELDTFEPDLSTLRRYKSSNLYSEGEPSILFRIYNTFTNNGFR